METTTLREAAPAALPAIQLPTTIDEVIARLAGMISECAAANDRAGYFAVLYHRVTCRIRECIAEKQFEDGKRMEQLDVIFANRYIQAYDLWRAGKPTSASWAIAFETTKVNVPLVLQHLLLGMNAHINLDLGIAASEVMHDQRMIGVQKDFYTINRILGELIEVVQKCLTSVNPLLNLLQLQRYNTDELLVSFSINTARDGAWMFANEIHGKTGTAYDQCFSARDKSISALGACLAKPKSGLLQLTIQIARMFERKNIKDVIELLGAK